jgi:hypothetical protein
MYGNTYGVGEPSRAGAGALGRMAGRLKTLFKEFF